MRLYCKRESKVEEGRLGKVGEELSFSSNKLPNYTTATGFYCYDLFVDAPHHPRNPHLRKGTR
jgi:hypothetical protein